VRKAKKSIDGALVVSEEQVAAAPQPAHLDCVASGQCKATTEVAQPSEVAK
jgi:hypothetical protein